MRILPCLATIEILALQRSFALPPPLTLTGDSSMYKYGEKYNKHQSQVCKADVALPLAVTNVNIDGLLERESEPSLREEQYSATQSTYKNECAPEERPLNSFKDLQVPCMTKRGAVGEAAGQIVTGLMVVGLLKQLYNAVAPVFQSHMQQTPSPPPMYNYGRQYSQGSIQSRDLQEVEGVLQNTSATSEDAQMVRRQVMDIASHFVNLGFAVQTVQENVGPISRELIRLEHEALHKAREWMHPDQNHYLQRRDVQIMEEKIDRRSMMDTILEHPTTAKVANSANILVTISMLTGMAGRYIDQVIQKAKTIMPGSQKQAPRQARNPYSYR